MQNFMPSKNFSNTIGLKSPRKKVLYDFLVNFFLQKNHKKFHSRKNTLRIFFNVVKLYNVGCRVLC